MKSKEKLKSFIEENKNLLDEYKIEELLIQANFLDAESGFELVNILKQCEEDGDYTPEYYVIAIYFSGTFCLHYFASTDLLKVNSFKSDKVEKFDNKEDADKFINTLKKSILNKIGDVKLLTVGVKK